jgi:hypothetical protein
MLNKKTCVRCFQKNEKAWDEDDWINGVVECPKEELILTYKNKPVPKSHEYYKLLLAIFSTQEIISTPTHCPYK